MDTPLVLSSTAFNDAARCLKKYEYRWIHRLVRKPKDVSVAIRRGTWIHRGLEVLDHGGGAAQVVDEFTRMKLWALDHDVDPDTVENVYWEALDLVLAYRQFWSTHADEYGPYETVGTEVPLSLMGTGNVGVKATLDRLVRDRAGRVWIWERKSTSDIPGSDWRTVDPQTMIQYLVAKADYKPVGIIFDYVLTDPGPKMRVKKDGRLYATAEGKNVRSASFELAVPEIRANWKEGTDWPDAESYIAAMRINMVNDALWFQRYPVFRPEDAVAETAKDIGFIASQIKLAQALNHYPRSLNLLTCRRFCEYNQLCSAEYLLGHPSAGRRREDFAVETDDLRSEGRSAS